VLSPEDVDDAASVATLGVVVVLTPKEKAGFDTEDAEVAACVEVVVVVEGNTNGAGLLVGLLEATPKRGAGDPAVEAGFVPKSGGAAVVVVVIVVVVVVAVTGVFVEEASFPDISFSSSLTFSSNSQ